MVKRIFLFILIALAAYAVYWFKFKTKEHHPEGPKPVPLALKKHSAKFNQSIDSLVTAYLDIKNAFVETDTAAAKKAAQNFIAHIATLPMEEMKKDTAMVLATVKANLDDMKSNAESLLKQTDITEMRRDFSSLTEVMFPSFFIAVNYEGPKLYLQKCPMAFNDTEAADWISNSPEIVNPYMGKHHPKYQSGMLSCGDVKDSIVSK